MARIIAIAVVLTAGMLAISGCGKKKQPEVQTMVASDVTSSSATLSGMLVDDGNDHIASLGFYYSTDREMGDKQTAICNDYDGSESYSVTISNLQSNTTYYYQTYAENGKGVGVGRVLTFATSSFSSGGSSGGSQGGGTPTPTPTPGQLNGHAYVDLGLPSGILWATCNVGAETPEGYGNYYAWGETTPKEDYSWSTYRWCNGDYNLLTKYCSNSEYGYNWFSDNLITLEPSDDAATANWGSAWRMPTRNEMSELLFSCTNEWIEQNGISGRLFTGPNGNSIFLPSNAYGATSYWSNTLRSDETYDAWGIIFTSGYCEMYDWGIRYLGLFVRPVCSSGIPSVQSYTVNFNANGGTGYMQPQAFVRGVSQALSANSFYRDGYTFSGWNTAANGNGISYSNRQEITVYSNLTLYAQWTANGGSQGSGQLNGHAYVDLGLPSGLKWATCNVGANNPEDYGNYYAWGETFTKSEYGESDYTYSDDPTILPASADAATVNWGAGWRMPTKEEMSELLSNCTNEWTTQNGVSGWIFTGSNGRSIFFPAAGSIYWSSLNYASTWGWYWSSSLRIDRTDYAWYLNFSTRDCSVYYDKRCCGRSVRPVCQ